MFGQKLPEDSASTIKVTAVSGVSGAEPGGESILCRFISERGKATVYGIFINGRRREGTDYRDCGGRKNQREYSLSLSLNNDLPKLTAGPNALVSRQEKSVTVCVNSNMDGYLYYLPEKKAETNGMPTAAEIRKSGKGAAIRTGENTVIMDGFEADESVLYLYEMSYAQRFSSGVRIDVPVYTPGPVDPCREGGSERRWQTEQRRRHPSVGWGDREPGLAVDQADMNGDGKLRMPT